MPVDAPILHALVIEPDQALRRAVRRWLRTHRVMTHEVATIPEGLAALVGPLDLVVGPGNTTLVPGEPECFGLDAVYRVVHRLRALPDTHRTADGLPVRRLPLVLLTQDPRAMDGAPPASGVVRAPVPLHPWEFLLAAATALELVHDELVEEASLAWDGAAYAPPGSAAGVAGRWRHAVVALRTAAQGR